MGFGRYLLRVFLTSIIFLTFTALGIFMVHPSSIVQQIALNLTVAVLAGFLVSIIMVVAKSPSSSPFNMDQKTEHRVLNLYIYMALVIISFIIGIFFGQIIWFLQGM